MRWRRVDPVQTIDAALILGANAADRLRAAIARSLLFRALRVAHGEDWAAVFAGEVAGPGGTREAILPRIPGAVPLYQAAPDWWLPAGVVVDAPAHVEATLWRAMAASRHIQPPAIVAPRFDADGTSGEADLYVARQAVPFERSSLAELA